VGPRDLLKIRSAAEPTIFSCDFEAPLSHARACPLRLVVKRAFESACRPVPRRFDSRPGDSISRAVAGRQIAGSNGLQLPEIGAAVNASPAAARSQHWSLRAVPGPPRRSSPEGFPANEQLSHRSGRYPLKAKCVCVGCSRARLPSIDQAGRVCRKASGAHGPAISGKRLGQAAARADQFTAPPVPGATPTCSSASPVPCHAVRRSIEPFESPKTAQSLSGAANVEGVPLAPFQLCSAAMGTARPAGSSRLRMRMRRGQSTAGRSGVKGSTALRQRPLPGDRPSPGKSSPQAHPKAESAQQRIGLPLKVPERWDPVRSCQVRHFTLRLTAAIAWRRAAHQGSSPLRGVVRRTGTQGKIPLGRRGREVFAQPHLPSALVPK